MRFKKRYLLYEIEGAELDEKTLRLVVRKAIYSLLGEHGSSEANVKIIEFDAKTRKFLLYCALGSLEKTIASLAFVTSFENKPLALRLSR